MAKKDKKAIESAWSDVQKALRVFTGLTGKIHVFIDGTDEEAMMMDYEVESMTEEIGILKINLL